MVDTISGQADAHLVVLALRALKLSKFSMTMLLMRCRLMICMIISTIIRMIVRTSPLLRINSVISTVMSVVRLIRMMTVVLCSITISFICMFIILLDSISTVVLSVRIIVFRVRTRRSPASLCYGYHYYIVAYCYC